MKRVILWLSAAVALAPFVSGVPQTDRQGANLILVSKEPEAAEIRNRVRSGESFELLAMRHSIGPSAEEGGYFVTTRAEDLRQELERALARLKPGEVSPVEKLGRMFFMLRRSTPDDDRWRSQYHAGQQALQERRYAEAALVFSTAAEDAAKFKGPPIEDQRVALSLQGLSRSYRLQGDYERAEPIARQSMTLFEKLLGPEHPGILPSLENLAAIEQGRAEFAEAEQHYRKILSTRWKAAPGSPDRDIVDLLEKLSAVLTDAYFRDSELENAFREFDQALTQTPLREDLYAGIAQGLFRVELVAEAETVMQRGIRRFPSSREIRYALAKIYVQASKYEAALGAFEASVRMDGPADPAVDRQQRGVIQERIASMNVLLVRFDAAAAAYKTALELSPDNLKASLGLADLYFRRGMMNEAMEEYTRTATTHRDSAAAHHGLADAFLHLGRFSESVAAAHQAIELDPKERASRYILGLALLRAGRTEQGQTALQDYERLEAEAQADQKHQRTLLELDRNAAIKMAGKQGEEAIGLWREALSSRPGAALETRLLMNLGVAQAKLGRHRDAAETFQTMIDRGIIDFLVHRNLAIQYELLGDSRYLQHRASYLQKYDAALKVILN
jgi:tetratricopeptide (TPR) repeat protein